MDLCLKVLLKDFFLNVTWGGGWAGTGTVGGSWRPRMKLDMMSIGTGKMIVLLFSAEMLLRVCR